MYQWLVENLKEYYTFVKVLKKKDCGEVFSPQAPHCPFSLRQKVGHPLFAAKSTLTLLSLKPKK